MSWAGLPLVQALPPLSVEPIRLHWGTELSWGTRRLVPVSIGALSSELKEERESSTQAQALVLGGQS